MRVRGLVDFMIATLLVGAVAGFAGAFVNIHDFVVNGEGPVVRLVTLPLGGAVALCVAIYLIVQKRRVFGKEAEERGRGRSGSRGTRGSGGQTTA